MSFLVKSLKLCSTLAVSLPVMFFFLIATCSAQTIGNWTLNNTLSGTGGTFNAVGAIAIGPGISSGAFNAGAEYFGENGWPGGGLHTHAYLQFTLTPNAGCGLDLTGMVLRMRRSNTGSPSGAGPTQWALRSSLDGYTTDISSGSLTHNYANYTVALSGFYNIPTAVTFRLYGYSATVPSGGISRFVIDNVSVQGLGYVLPLHITAFRAVADHKGRVAASWTAQQVTAGTHFSLQRSLNGTGFLPVGDVGEGTACAVKTYTFTDDQVPPSASKIFYRIQATEPGGMVYYSLVSAVSIRVGLPAIDHISVRGQSLIAQVQLPDKADMTVTIQSADGRCIQRKMLHEEAGMHTVELPIKTTARGVYIFSLHGNGAVISRRFVY